MKLRQYKKALDIFKVWYTKKVLDFQKQLGGEGELPQWTNEQLESICAAAGSSLFHFLDEQNIFISINVDNNKFSYFIYANLTENSKTVVPKDGYNKRIECEFAAIENGFEILNDK